MMEPMNPQEMILEKRAGKTLELLLKVARKRKEKHPSPGSTLSPTASEASGEGAVASKDDMSEAEVDSSETADWGVAVLRKMTGFTPVDLASAMADVLGPVAQDELFKMMDCLQQQPSKLDIAWEKNLRILLEAAKLIKSHEQLRSVRKVEADDLDEEAVDKLYGKLPKLMEGSTPKDIDVAHKTKFTLAAEFMNDRSQILRLIAGLRMMDCLVTANLHLVELFEQSLTEKNVL